MDGDSDELRHRVRLVLTYDLLVDEARLRRLLAGDAPPPADGVTALVDVLARGLSGPQAPGIAVLASGHESTSLGVVALGGDQGAVDVLVRDDRGGWGPVLRRLARGLLSWD